MKIESAGSPCRTNSWPGGSSMGIRRPANWMRVLSSNSLNMLKPLSVHLHKRPQDTLSTCYPAQGNTWEPAVPCEAIGNFTSERHWKLSQNGCLIEQVPSCPYLAVVCLHSLTENIEDLMAYVVRPAKNQWLHMIVFCTMAHVNFLCHVFGKSPWIYPLPHVRNPGLVLLCRFCVSSGWLHKLAHGSDQETKQHDVCKHHKNYNYLLDPCLGRKITISNRRNLQEITKYNSKLRNRQNAGMRIGNCPRGVYRCHGPVDACQVVLSITLFFVALQPGTYIVLVLQPCSDIQNASKEIDHEGNSVYDSYRIHQPHRKFVQKWVLFHCSYNYCGVHTLSRTHLLLRTSPNCSTIICALDCSIVIDNK